MNSDTSIGTSYFLKRAGLSGFDRDGVLWLSSSVVPEIRASGVNVPEAVADYFSQLQRPNEWLSLAELHLQDVLAFDDVDEFDLESPMAFWNMLVDDVFRPAYLQASSNALIIERTYAFAECCLAQRQPAETIPSQHLSTCATICFFESLPYDESSLADMPNWFSLEEVEHIFLNNSFTRDKASEIWSVFEATKSIGSD